MTECRISYGVLEKRSTSLRPEAPLHSSSLQRWLTGDRELDWLDIELMVRVCHEHDPARVPAWSAMDDWHACYERVSETEPPAREKSPATRTSGGSGAKKKKKAKKRHKGPTTGGITITNGEGGVVNYVSGKKNKTRGSAAVARFSIKQWITGAAIVILLGAGSAYGFLYDDMSHDASDNITEGPTAPDSPSAGADESRSASPSASASTPASEPGTPKSSAPVDGREPTSRVSDANADGGPTTSSSPRPSGSPDISTEPEVRPEAPHFQVTGGQCDVSDAAGGSPNVLGNQSSGFTDGGQTYNEIVLASDHSKSIATTYGRNGKVVNGSSGWFWPCESDDPPGTYDVRVKDVASGLWSDWSSLVIVP